jgi:SPP1 family predicted phage head-tail adaptor
MTQAAGELRHRIEVLSLKTSRHSTTGEVLECWKVERKLWARVTPLSGKEFIAAQAEASKVTARIRIRYRTDIDHTMRISHGDKVYNIEAVLPDNESGLEWLTLMVSEGVERNGLDLCEVDDD